MKSVLQGRLGSEWIPAAPGSSSYSTVSGYTGWQAVQYSRALQLPYQVTARQNTLGGALIAGGEFSVQAKPLQPLQKEDLQSHCLYDHIHVM